MALFDSPSTARELLGNIKLLAERDFLVQSAFFDEQVLTSSKKMVAAPAFGCERGNTRKDKVMPY